MAFGLQDADGRLSEPMTIHCTSQLLKYSAQNVGTMRRRSETNGANSALSRLLMKKRHIAAVTHRLVELPPARFIRMVVGPCAS